MKIELIGISVLLCLISSIYCDGQTDNDVYTIEQSIDTNEYKEIGNLNLRLIRQNQNSAQYQSLNADESNEIPTQFPAFATLIETNQFDDSIIEQIRSANENNNALYRLRLCKKIQSSSACFASSFTYLRNIIESKMIVNLTLYTGLNNRLNSLSIKTSPASQTGTKENLNSLVVYAYIQNIKTALGPDTETYLEKIKKEVEQKEKGAQADNQSFLSKYWIYIVPFMIIMFLMNIMNPEGGAAPGGR